MRWASAEELFTWAMRGDPHAAKLCLDVFNWSNTYDHLADDESADLHRDLHDAMWALAVKVPHNEFYQRNCGELSVSMANAITTWRTSILLQRTGDLHDARLAYVLRWVPAEFFLHCARLVAGPEWANEIAPEFWRAMTQDHSFEQFLAECGG